MSQEIPLAPGLLKDFTAFAQVVLPDPPAGHHNLALHFFDHDGREAGRILFHHIPLFHSYGALPSLVSKGSCYAVIQSSNQAGARIVTVSEEDHQSQNGGKQSGWVLRRSSLNKPKFQWMYLQMYLLFLNLKMDVSANGDSDFGLGNYHFQVPSLISFSFILTCVDSRFVCRGPPKAADHRKVQKDLKTPCCSDFCPTAMCQSH